MSVVTLSKFLKYIRNISFFKLSFVKLLSYLKTIFIVFCTSWFYTKKTVTKHGEYLNAIYMECAVIMEEDAESPLDFLKQELKDPDLAIRIHAAKNVHLIASAIDLTTCRQDLIPLLEEIQSDDQTDEFLYALASQWSHLASLIGGKWAYLVIKPLIFLSRSDERVVREEACKAAEHVLNTFKHTTIIKSHAIPCVIKLAAGRDFASKVSASCWITNICKALDASNEELIRTYFCLCTDNSPIVRNEAAKNFAHILPYLDKVEHIKAFDLIKSLWSDQSDDIRISIFKSIMFYVKHFDEKILNDEVLPIIIESAEDNSWKVRVVSVEYFELYIEVFGIDVVSNSLLHLYISNFWDREPLVCSTSIVTLAKQIKHFPVETAKLRIVEKFETLLTSTSKEYAISLVLIYLFELKEKGPSLEKLFSVMQQLSVSKDLSTRLNVAESLFQICEIVGGTETIDKITPIFIAFASDLQWRVRFSISNQIANFYKVMTAESFKRCMLPIFSSLLLDDVCNIRNATIEQINKLAAVIGCEWVETNIAKLIFSKFDDMQDKSGEFGGESSYLTRITLINSLCYILSITANSSIIEKIISILSFTMKDAVPNVRLSSIQAVSTIYNSGKLKKEMQLTCIEFLNTLKDDEDIDVRYEALAALKLHCAESISKSSDNI